jgi:hypothetical protein
MVLAFKLPCGAEMHEPPYTEEEMEFYRRVGNGPVAILHSDPEMVKRLEARLRIAERENTEKPKPKEPHATRADRDQILP